MDWSLASHKIGRVTIFAYAIDLASLAFIQLIFLAAGENAVQQLLKTQNAGELLLFTTILGPIIETVAIAICAELARSISRNAKPIVVISLLAAIVHAIDSPLSAPGVFLCFRLFVTCYFEGRAEGLTAAFLHAMIPHSVSNGLVVMTRAAGSIVVD